METNYSDTLTKAKSYFKSMIKEREKYMQQTTLELPKRIEIQTLPLTTSKDGKAVENLNKLETIEHNEPECATISKPKVNKKKSSYHAKPPRTKIESFDLRNMNKSTEAHNCRNESSSNSIVQSLSLSTESPISTSVKISTSSSTVRINQKCQEAIEKAKYYFKTKENPKVGKTSQNTKKNSKVNESTSTKTVDNNQNPDNFADITKTNTAEDRITKKGKIYSQKKITCFEALTPAKKYLKSKLGLDQKSINVKKDKEVYSHSKTHMYRMSTKIKSFPIAKQESKKNTNQKETKPESPQTGTQTSDKTPEHLTPAKRYLRSKLGFEEKFTNTKKDSTKLIQNPIVKDATASIETQTVPRPESPAKFSAKLQPISPVKVRQPISRNRESNFKKLSAANENYKKEKHKPKSAREIGSLTTKTDIVTSIQPGSRETNRISIELRKPIVLTSSMEELLSKALRIGLKKINRSDLQDLHLKIKASVQSRNNMSSVISVRSDLTSMQSKLESKISDFQTEMERRQKHTFDKIQELENTIQLRKQQLMEISKCKNVAMKK